MPSIFDLFGTLDLKTGAFENSILAADRKLTDLKGQISTVEAESRRLGDSSAQTGRKFEKLTETVDRQREKLIQAAAAFSTGSINSERFAVVTAQVDRATANLNSRLKDTQARLQDIAAAGPNTQRALQNVSNSRPTITTGGDSPGIDGTAHLTTPAAQAISDEQFRRGSQLAAANAFAAEDKLQRAAALESSRAKLEIYRAEKAAEIGLEEQTAGKIKQIRGFGAVFRAAGLTGLGINESEINAVIALYNRQIEKSGEAAKALALVSAAQTGATIATGASAAADVGAATAAETLAAAKLHLIAASETLAVVQGAETASAGALASAQAGVALATEAVADAEAQLVAESILLGSGATAITTGFVGAAAAIAAAGVAIVAVTSKLATEAENRLRAEENIAAAYNKQVISLREALADYEKLKQNAIDAERFTSKISDLGKQGQTSALSALIQQTDNDNKARIAEINRLQTNLAAAEKSLETEKNRPTGRTFGSIAKTALKDVAFPGLFSPSDFETGLSEDAKRTNVTQSQFAVEQLKKQIADENALLQQGTSQRDQATKSLSDTVANQNKLFADKFESFKKSSESERDFALKTSEAVQEAEKKKQEQIKETIQKLDQLQKIQTDAVRGVAAATAKDNPIAQIMLANQVSVEKLKESLKGLPPLLAASQLALQGAQNGADVFGARLDAALNAISLRSQADKFRGPTQNEQFKKLQDRLAADGIALSGNASNFTLNVPGDRNQAAVQAFVDEQANKIANQPREKIQALLDKQLSAAGIGKTELEKARADLAITNLAGSVNPEDIRRDQREQIAKAIDREADRKDAQAAAAIDTAKNTALLVEKVDALTKAEEKRAEQGVKLDLAFKDDTSDQKFTGAKAATPDDVGRQYQFDGFGIANGSNQ